MSADPRLETSGRPRHNPDRIAFLYLAASILLGVVGQMALKTVSAELTGIHVSLTNPLALPEAIIRSPRILLGFVLYGSGEFLWLLALSRADLSALYPYTAISFVLVLTGSAFWFREVITVTRIIGVVVVALGIFLFARDERRAAARERRIRAEEAARGEP